MLPERRERLVAWIKDNLSIVLEEYPLEKVSETYEELAIWLQALGICNLLLYADPERFFENLLRSGQTRRAFLRKCRSQGLTGDYQMAISRWESFFDAVAADDFDLAREIVALSPSDWVPDGEYEDDFCYYHFFHTLVAGHAQLGGPAAERILGRFEKALKGVASPRLAVCKSFHARDAAQFGEAFAALLGERAARMERDAKTFLVDEPSFMPRKNVFVEGLALLRFADRLGFQVESEYRFCPSLARQPRTTPRPTDVYEEIDRANAGGVRS